MFESILQEERFESDLRYSQYQDVFGLTRFVRKTVP